MTKTQQQFSDYLTGVSNKLPDLDATNIVEAQQLIRFISGTRDALNQEAWDLMVELMEYVYEASSILSRGCTFPTLGCDEVDPRT